MQLAAVLAWLNNPWTVGIMGGVISGVIVTGITNWILGRKEKREYLARVRTANHEVMQTVRPSVAEKVFPALHVLESLIRSTAEKHAVRSRDLLDVDAICNNIIKEIMDNSFLSSQQKKNFCELVSNMKNKESLEHRDRRPPEPAQAPPKGFSHAAGFAAGAVAAVISLFLAVRPELGGLAAGIGEQGRTGAWIGIAAVTLVIPLLNFLIFTQMHARRRRRADRQSRAKLEQERKQARQAVTNSMRKIRRSEARRRS